MTTACHRNVVQRHTACASALADFTTLYDGFGQQMGNLDTVTGSQASAEIGKILVSCQQPAHKLSNLAVVIRTVSAFKSERIMPGKRP